MKGEGGHIGSNVEDDGKGSVRIDSGAKSHKHTSGQQVGRAAVKEQLGL